MLDSTAPAGPAEPSEARAAALEPRANALEAAEPPPSIADLPQDVLILLAELVDGVTLCRLSALTSHALRAAFEDILAPAWVAKHTLLLEAAAPSPDDEATPQHLCEHSATAAMHAYARSWSALERRCPRCGKRSPLSRSAHGAVVFESGRFMHLCDWLLPPKRSPP